MTTGRIIRVLVVDDSALIRQMFSEILSSDPMIEVVDAACDPIDAREKIKRHNPDVVTLDIEMPRMDGLSFLEKIMTLRPMPVIMVSSLTQKNATETLRALEIGAFDYVSKPSSQPSSEIIALLARELIEKVKNAARANLRVGMSTALPAKPLALRAASSRCKMIAIGASTGGVEALRLILSRLPIGLPPIVIAQHMPKLFTASFAARLDQLCAITVHEAKHQQTLEPGCAYIAPGDFHLRVAPLGMRFECHLDGTSAQVSGHRPSVDVMFQSVAKHVGAKAMGVILTGMGRDGAEGLLAMRQAGAATLGQDQATCTVYGMPGAAMRLGAVQQEVALEKKIAEHIVHYCESREAA